MQAKYIWVVEEVGVTSGDHACWQLSNIDCACHGYLHAGSEGEEEDDGEGLRVFVVSNIPLSQGSRNIHHQRLDEVGGEEPCSPSAPKMVRQSTRDETTGKEPT